MLLVQPAARIPRESPAKGRRGRGAGHGCCGARCGGQLRFWTLLPKRRAPGWWVGRGTECLSRGAPGSLWDHFVSLSGAIAVRGGGIQHLSHLHKDLPVCIADAVVLGAAVGPWGAGNPGSCLAEPSQSPSPTAEPGLAPGSFCAGVVSKVSPFLSRLQGGRSNRVQIMKPTSCSRVISHLCQMRFITVLGGVSKCWAGGSSVHPAGPTSAGAVARLRVAPQDCWGDQGCSRVSKQSCSFPWVMCVSSTGTWSLGE